MYRTWLTVSSLMALSSLETRMGTAMLLARPTLGQHVTLTKGSRIALFSSAPRDAVPALQIPRDERHQHDQYAGDGQIAHRATEIPTATGQGPAREGVGHRRGDHAHRRGGDVGPEANPRDPVGAVLKVEREERDEPGDHHDAPAVAGHRLVHACQAG